MAAYRYFRCLCLTTNGGVFAIAEWVASTTIGGATIFTGGTASASSSFGGFPASQAFDGNPSTAWASTSATSGEHLDYDLGSGNSADISAGEVSLAARNDNSANQMPITATILGSNDGINYTTIFNFVGVASPALGQIQWTPGPTTKAFWDANNKTSTVQLSTSSQLIATSAGASSVAVNRPLTGKHYAEVTITTLTGTPVIGLVNSFYSMATATLLGGDINSIGYRSGGAVVANSVTLATLGSFVAGDRIGIAVDPANRLIWFRVNNGNWNNNGANDPATGVGGIDYSSLTLGRFLLAAGFSASGAKWTAKFDATFTDTPPSGFSSISSVAYTLARNVAEAAEVNSIVAQQFSPAARAFPSPLDKYQRAFSPSGPITTVSGIVEESGTPVAGRVVECYDRDTGELLGRTLSDGSGVWSITALGRPSVRVVGSDPTAFNSLVFDNVVPL